MKVRSSYVRGSTGERKAVAYHRVVLGKTWLAYQAYSRWLTKLSSTLTLGLNLTEVPSFDEIIAQGKVLCQDYVYQRLKRQNLLSMKLELKGAGHKCSDVSLEIQYIGTELERMYPELYMSISRQVNVTLTSEAVVRKTFMALADQLFKNSVTWGKVIALYALASALAVDCVQQGHPQFVSAVVDTFGKITSRHLVEWIARQGGWTDIIRVFRTSKDAQVVWLLSFIGAALGFVITLSATVRL